MSSRQRCVTSRPKGFLDTDTFQAYNKILDDTRDKLTDTEKRLRKLQLSWHLSRLLKSRATHFKTFWEASTRRYRHSPLWMNNTASWLLTFSQAG
jgi:hypothetical protein